MNSAPGRAEKLDAADIQRVIDDLLLENALKTIVFAGGEPLLLGEQLFDSIAHASDRGLNTRVVTNAYWAVSPSRARKTLLDLRAAGLHELNISADDYHLPYVPIERVAYAWHASKGLGFKCVIIANSTGPASQITPEFLSDFLGEDLALRYDDDGWAQPLGPPAADGTVYAICNTTLQRLGRAHTEMSVGDTVYPKDPEEINIACPWAVRSAALSPKGHLLSCCGFEVEDNDVLDFGDTRTLSADALVHVADQNVIVNAIALLGPVYLKEFIRQRAPAVSFRERYTSMCEVCEHVVTRTETLDVLRNHMPELANVVLTARDNAVTPLLKEEMAHA